MIGKMTKYSFILLGNRKDDFLERLRTLGVIDITRSNKPNDACSEKMLADINAVKSLVRNLERGSDARLEELKAEKAALAKTLADVTPWGEFNLSELEATGLGIRFFCIRQKAFKEEWREQYAIQKVLEDDGKVWFVVVGSCEGFPCKPVATPATTASETRSLIDAKDKEIADYAAQLETRKAEIPSLEKKLTGLQSDLSVYLAGQKGVAAAENTLVTFEGFAPSDKDTELKAAFDVTDGIFWWSEPAVAEDNPPIEFRNNSFVRMFEPLTDMYGRPAYNGFDPTPYISVFFLLFFAMCMGDAGYGIILMIAGFLLKKVRSFANLAPLVVTLGAGTVVVGFFFHTFFSMDMSGWQWIPEGVRKVFVPAKVSEYDGTMVLSLIIGIIHLCLAMTVKAVTAVKNNGFLNSLGVLGWTLLIVGGVVVGAFALTGVLDSTVTKIVIIVLGIVSALGIFLFNNIHRNPLVNIGSGLWDTYNTATGILGDVLSYLRLYALGLAGGMLGAAFNELAVTARGDGGFGWIGCILIILVGHTLNIAMAALGAFVHPLRLNFLEFFKNSGYEGTGHKYNPIK